MKDIEDGKILRDNALVEKTRLSIMLYLHLRSKARFKLLQDSLSLSSGNLATHLKKLEESGLIDVRWDLADTRSRIISITAEGRRKVSDFLEALKDYDISDQY